MIYLNKLMETIKNMDNKIYRIMIKGFKISFLILLLSCYILSFYKSSGLQDVFFIGISIFRAALSYGVTFFVFALVFNYTKQNNLK